jgi:uncharacterized cupin superfamily protein
MSTTPGIVTLDRLLQGESANPSPENILAGIPRARVANQYADAGNQFFCGVWHSSSGKWRIRYTEHEFCVMLEGRVRIESVAGERYEFRAGDAFVVPAGFEGSWEVIEACRKWYAIFEPRGATPDSVGATG